VLVSLGAALAACPPTVRTLPADAGTLDFVGRSCNVDAECGELRCDKVRRQCICLSDESCKSTNPEDPIRYCNNYTGLCVTEIAGCTQDTDCKDAAGKQDLTQYCDSSIRSCRPLKGFCEGCALDTECGGAADNCLLDTNLNQKFCSKACGATADCPRGAGCMAINGVNQCWPAPNPAIPGDKPSCKNFRGCTPDSLRTCNSNADCADVGSQRCDPSKGKCVAIDQVCPFGTVCDPRGKICVAECSADADCGDPKLRCSNKVCEPIGECVNDVQCPANKVCSVPPGQTAGQCLPFCTGDLDCPIGNVCLKQTDKYRCVPGCASNSGCPIEQRCNPSTKQCEGQVVGSVRTCQATVACNSCELCNPTKFECYAAKGTYPHCAPCAGAGDCTGGACVQMADAKTYCAKFCGTGQECPEGFVCTSVGATGQSACVPSDRLCLNKCP
jgi:hypothetical protein